MASASSYLFYGVFVTLPSLLIAANAYEKISPQLLALDLISLRARKGNLSTEVAYGVTTRIAAELWSLIRAELENMVWIEAEGDLVKSVLRERCPCCHSDDEGSQSGRSSPLLWATVESQDELDEDLFYPLMQSPFDTLSMQDLKVSFRLLRTTLC